MLRRTLTGEGITPAPGFVSKVYTLREGEEGKEGETEKVRNVTDSSAQPRVAARAFLQ